MISFKAILGTLFALLVASIVGWGIVSFRNNKISIETADRVRRSHEMIELTNEISSLYKDIQLESNAFFISGDSSLLQPYLNSKQQLIPCVERLRKITHDNINQQARIDSLLVCAKLLITFTDGGLLKNETDYSSDILSERVKVGGLHRQNIRKIIQHIKDDEQTALIKAEQAFERSIAAFNKTFILLITGIGALLATTFFSIRYNFNKRIKAQEEQKQATELFTKLFYESPIGIVISQTDTGEIIDCNNAYTELIRYSKSELIGKTAVQLGILDTTTRSEILAAAINTGTGKDIEVHLKPKNGDPVSVSISMQSIQVGNKNCLLSAVLDMTTHKEAEEKVRQALVSEIELNKLKSNFITLASHEFRTPLTTILSSAFLLDNYAFGEHREKVSKHVARIKGSVNLLISILDEFLSLTKIEEGKVAPKKEWIDLKETLEALCGNFRMAAKPGQKIIYHHYGEQQVYSDPVLLGNIVNNLVSNAIKYSNENEEIVISSAVNAKIHLSVKDAGIGISQSDQAHLFERFFRASNAGNIQGTGLGLHIMKHYIDMLHGSIEVQSEPGKGSEFKVTFDLSPPESN